MLTLQEILLIGFATWRLTSLFVQEDGVFRMFTIFRIIFGFSVHKEDDKRVPTLEAVKLAYKDQLKGFVFKPKNELGKALMCTWCTSVWVAAFCLVLFYTPFAFLLYLLAVSCVAILVNEV